MNKVKRDACLDTLLHLNGEEYFIDDKHWVKFVVREVEPSKDRPHGLDYSLTLHDENGERLVGFDNAHSVKTGKGPGAKKSKTRDHKHRFRTIKPYDYTDAGKLLEDFWTEVDSVLQERGAMK